MIQIEIVDHDILATLRRLQNHSDNLRPALLKIGEKLKESTHQRFSNKTGPDGHAWLSNAESTIERKGRDFALTDGGTLGNTINYQAGIDELLIGSPMEYAAMMQFGGTKSEFLNLWGDIPARPFLGVSDADKNELLRILEHHLSL